MAQGDRLPGGNWKANSSRRACERSFRNDDLNVPFSPQDIDPHVFPVANEQQVNRRTAHGQIVNPQFAQRRRQVGTGTTSAAAGMRPT